MERKLTTARRICFALNCYDFAIVFVNLIGLIFSLFAIGGSEAILNRMTSMLQAANANDNSGVMDFLMGLAGLLGGAILMAAVIIFFVFRIALVLNCLPPLIVGWRTNRLVKRELHTNPQLAKSSLLKDGIVKLVFHGILLLFWVICAIFLNLSGLLIIFLLLGHYGICMLSVVQLLIVTGTKITAPKCTDKDSCG